MRTRWLDQYPDVLTPEEAMAVLQIGRNKIYELLRTGQLEAMKIGKLYRIPKESIHRFLRSCLT